MTSPLNLATRPASNERLPAVIFSLAAALLAGLTVWHGLLLSRLASTAATSLDDEVVRLEQEVRDLRERERSLQTGRTDAATLVRWRLLKGLVDQRAFSWTGLLASLEDTVPADVRLLGISPQAKEGTLRIALDAVAQESVDAVTLVETLEARPEFEDVFLLKLAVDGEGMRCNYEMTYRAGATPRIPAPKAAAAPPDLEEPGA
jgi:hypothetical protein